MMQELNYIRCGDYYIPDIRLPEENRPIGRWGRMHRDYIKEHMIRVCMLSNQTIVTYVVKMSSHSYCKIHLRDIWKSVILIDSTNMRLQPMIF